MSEGEARAGTYNVVRVVHVRLHLSLDPNEGGISYRAGWGAGDVLVDALCLHDQHRSDQFLVG